MSPNNNNLYATVSVCLLYFHLCTLVAGRAARVLWWSDNAAMLVRYISQLDHLYSQIFISGVNSFSKISNKSQTRRSEVMNQHSFLEATKRLLKIALVGAPNAGKSTLLNKLILSDVSCVSNKVHTTRKNLIAAYTEGDTQLEFYDSPGIVTREHLLKHRLEDSLAHDPAEAAQICDLIAVVVDASNPREKRKLNKGISNILHNHLEKKSFLIMNKIDLVKEKRQLLEIGARLSEGYLENKPVTDEIVQENILKKEKSLKFIRTTSKYVIELDKKQTRPTEQRLSEDVNHEEKDPFATGYKNFSRIFSISALNDDGVDELREAMLAIAKPVEQWPHGPDFVCSKNAKEIVSSIVRGKVMDYTDHQVPYVVRYYFQQCVYDEFGSLHVNLDLKVPNKYMVGKLLGEHGVIIFRIINESREMISNVLGCDVKLNITVKGKKDS